MAQDRYLRCISEDHYADYIKVLSLIQDYMSEGELEAAKRIFGTMATVCDGDLMRKLYEFS